MMKFGFLLKNRRKQEIYEACYEHAQKFHLQKEFREAYKFHKNDPLLALEEWDLLNQEVIDKIDDINQRYEKK